MRKVPVVLSALFLTCSALPASAQQPVVPSYSTTGNPPFSPVTPSFGLPVICESGCGGGTVLSKSGTYASSGTDQFALSVGTNTQLTVPATTTCAQITVEGASIRRTSDTTSATTTNGTLIPAGSAWQDCGPLAAYKFTAVSGSPTLDVEYFK